MGGKKLVSIETCVRTGERVTSPRSLEACRRSGIEPDELQPKSVNEFLHERLGGLLAAKFSLVEKEAAVLRQRHYEQSRQAKLELVARERDAILQSQDNSDAGPPRSPVPSATKQSLPQPPPARRTRSAGSHATWRAPPRRSNDDNDDNDDDNDNDDDERDNPADVVVAVGDMATVQLEERLLAKMKLRQQREIRGVIETEAKLARIQHEDARRAAEDARRRDEFQRELRAKRAQLVASKHAREMATQQQENRDAAQRRLRAKERAETERAARDGEQQRAQQRQHEALQREHERALKANAFRQQTEALLQHHEDIVATNRQRMLEKERHALATLELATKRRHHEAIARRDRANARLQHASAQTQLRLERKKCELESKQASAAERAKEVQQKTLRELQERASQQRQDEDVRRKRLDAARSQRENEAAALRSKRQEVEEKLARAEAERERARQLQAVEKTLVGEEKQQTVERIRRREEYARLQLLARISGEDERSRAIKARKHALLQARQQVALDSLLRKHRIGQAVEQLRRSNKWDKYEDILYEL
ncbi:hypothetical protein PybrP1_003423 [[Pythium] brassicae (nom. inval.)]|nr:hypothetical protein PybrP1_003423 [[Pythium] brassicae (nom. inval.)]